MQVKYVTIEGSSGIRNHESDISSHCQWDDLRWDAVRDAGEWGGCLSVLSVCVFRLWLWHAGHCGMEQRLSRGLWSVSVSSVCQQSSMRWVCWRCLQPAAAQRLRLPTYGFYARKQLLLSARLSHRNSVCLSVRPSHGWISQKRCKLGSPNLHRRLPERL